MKTIYSILYPCLECADALKAALQSEKLDCSSRDGLILWTARYEYYLFNVIPYKVIYFKDSQ